MISSGGCGVESQEDVHEPARDFLMPGHDLLVAAVGARPDGRQLQAIERALAGQRLAAVAQFKSMLTGDIFLAHQRGQERISPQLVVVVQVFVTQGQREDPLLDQVRHRVLDEIGIAKIIEAAGQFGQHPRPGLDLPQQQAARIGRDRPAIKPGRDFAAAQGLKIERPFATLCRHRAASLLVR